MCLLLIRKLYLIIKYLSCFLLLVELSYFCKKVLDFLGFPVHITIISKKNKSVFFFIYL